MESSITKMQDCLIKEASMKALISVIVYIIIDLCNEKYSANYNITNLPIVNFFNQVYACKLIVRLSRIKVIPIIIQILLKTLILIISR